MTKEFSTVGVFGKRDSLDYEPLRIIAELLIKSGRQVLLEKKPAEALSLGEGYTRDEIGKKSDLIIIYGGDGTFLGVSRRMAHYDVPFIGINAGRLGLSPISFRQNGRRNFRDLKRPLLHRYPLPLRRHSDPQR